MFNNGESTRDFTYIDDLVDAIVSMLDKEQIYTHKILHKKFNIGSEKPIKILDFIKIIEDKLNLKPRKLYASSGRRYAKYFFRLNSNKEDYW